MERDRGEERERRIHLEKGRERRRREGAIYREKFAERNNEM